MSVTPIEGEGVTRYYVQSERAGAKPCTVDLESYFGLGWCNCPNFAINIEPTVSRWRREERSLSPEFMCKHIRAARAYLGDDLVTRFLRLKKRDEQQLRKR